MANFCPRIANTDVQRLLIVGNKGGTNVGESLWRAARARGLEVAFCDARQAFRGPRLLSSLAWRLLGHRPLRLSQFSKRVLARCREERPDLLISTGLAPVDWKTLDALRQLGVRCLNYLTDDPWNPSFRSKWFLNALPFYDVVFSPRRNNLADLISLGCREVAYLPFAYDRALFFPEEPESEGEKARLQADVIFAGGADDDRIPYMAAIRSAGFSLALYGDYWDRYSETRSAHRGYASVATLRKATRAAKIALCLVRHANRDGHVMRSFEIPAVGACMLVEDTAEHRALFGAEGERCLYFEGEREMVEKARRLAADEEERCRLAAAAHEHIVSGGHTYGDRLAQMLDSA